jgi:predicted 3-demethylubiquinone-9 3-methyltransferase (glyoxalase superfamily)
MPQITPFLMFNGRLEEAVTFYKSVFADAKIESLSAQSATFELGGQRFLAFDGGDHFSFSDGISLYVDCADQQEVDFYWEKLSANGGETGYCGWLKDAFGVSWQVIPKALSECLSGEDKEGAGRAMQAMMGMTKIEVDGLKKAYEGNAA